MKKVFNIEFLIITFLFTILFFLLFSCSFETVYMGESAGRGIGFPFIWQAKNPTTSLYFIVDGVALLIDFLVYYICTTFLLFFVLKDRKFVYYYTQKKKNVLWILSIITICVVLLHIPLFLLSELYPIEYSPVYRTIRVVPLLFQ